MGKIIKINMYVETKRKSNDIFKVRHLEQNILKYYNWLKKTNKEDKIENYEEFLRSEYLLKGSK
jgi:N-acetylmuramoyl-L-alanine amidase CwlA